MCERPERHVKDPLKTCEKPAKKIYLLAWGTGKSDIIKKAIEEDVNEKCQASFLRKHQNLEYILDKYSTSKLNDSLQVNRN